MRTIYKISIITIQLLFFLSVQFVSAQEFLTKEQQMLIEDYDYFIRQLESIHPDPYSAYGGEIGFRKSVDSLRIALNEEQDLDAVFLQQKVSQFLIPLHDGHTHCGYMNVTQSDEIRFLPIDFRAVSDGFFVNGWTKQYEGLCGARLLRVGGLPIDDILDRISLLTPVENRYGLYNKFLDSRLNSTILEMLLPDFDGQHVEMQFLTTEETDTCIVMQMLSKDEIRHQQFFSVGQDTRFPKNNLEYRWADKQRGVMTFRCTHVISRDCLSFMCDNGMDYQSALEWAWGETSFDSIPSMASQFGAMLQEMKAIHAQHLIIDLRGNGGGWTPIIYATLYQLFGDEYLLKDLGLQYNTKISEAYLQKNATTLKDFNSANGTNCKLGDMFGNNDVRGVAQINDSILEKIIDGYICLDKETLHKQHGNPFYRPEHIYVVTDQSTFSAAFHYAFMLWKMGATIVGVPSSQAPNTFMESTEFSLPHSGVSCSVSNSLQTFLPIEDPRSKVLWPDWMLKYDDYKRYDFDENAALLYILDHLIKQ